MTTKGDLAQAYLHNIRENQIGETDGMSPEVAADLGYLTYDTTAELIADFDPQVLKVAKGIGQTTCGDCGEVVPCAHVGTSRNGQRYTVGH